MASVICGSVSSMIDKVLYLQLGFHNANKIARLSQITKVDNLPSFRCPFRHSVAPSVIPLFSLRHSCGSRNPVLINQLNTGFRVKHGMTGRKKARNDTLPRHSCGSRNPVLVNQLNTGFRVKHGMTGWGKRHGMTHSSVIPAKAGIQYWLTN